MRVAGSGPFGEKAESAFHTFDQLPEALKLGPLPSAPTRTDIDLGPGGLAFRIDGIMTASEADALADVSDAIGYSRFAPAIRTPPGMRQNLAAHWIGSVETVTYFMRPLFERFSWLLPSEVDGGTLHNELSHRVAHYKYTDVSGMGIVALGAHLSPASVPPQSRPSLTTLSLPCARATCSTGTRMGSGRGRASMPRATVTGPGFGAAQPPRSSM